MRSRSKKTGTRLVATQGRLSRPPKPARRPARPPDSTAGRAAPSRGRGQASAAAARQLAPGAEELAGALRLVLLIAIPTLTAVVLGGTSILSYARSAHAPTGGSSSSPR